MKIASYRHIGRQALAILLVPLLTWPTSLSWAGSKPKIMVPPLMGSSDHGARRAVIQAFQDSGRVATVSMNDIDRYLRDQQKGSRRDSGSLQASKLFSEAKAAYAQLDIDQAIKKWTAAKMSYRENLGQEKAFDGLRATQFHLAMAYLAKGKKARAREELKEVVRLDPHRADRKISAKLYPPNVRKLYEDVRSEIAGDATGSIEIDSRPSGAIVYVDGESVGSTPVRVTKLPVGEHFISMNANGYQPFLISKFIVAGENREEATLKQALRDNPLTFFSVVSDSTPVEHRRAAFLDEMGVQLGGDIFVFLTPAKGAVSAQLYDQRSQEMSPVETEKTPSNLVAKLLQHLDSTGYVSTKPLKPVTEQLQVQRELPEHLKPQTEQTLTQQVEQPEEAGGLSRDTTPWYKKRWVWIAIGGGLLASGGVAFLITRSGSSASTSTLTTTIPGP